MHFRLGIFVRNLKGSFPGYKLSKKPIFLESSAMITHLHLSFSPYAFLTELSTRDDWFLRGHAYAACTFLHVCLRILMSSSIKGFSSRPDDSFVIRAIEKAVSGIPVG